MHDADPASVQFGPLTLLIGSASCTPACSLGGVINCAAEVPNLPFGVPTLRLEWREVQGELLTDVEPSVLSFARERRSFGPLLVHCAAGKVKVKAGALDTRTHTHMWF